ncbi:MAG TPA: alpha/beta hydrolase, partial [Herpetosiphonaceae bacterium]|nr:alpha/beta hydrolase [Herpetosiphonaceae bacterium]
MHSTRPADAEGFRPLAELVPGHWRSEFVAAGGVRLHYTRTGGARPPLLLLHGLQADGLTWLRTARRFEGDYDVIMPDLRGHGRSDRLAAGLQGAELVNDTLALLDALGIENPPIVGHSMGADIAGRVAAAGRARSVALVDPALRNVAAAMPAPGAEP